MIPVCLPRSRANLLSVFASFDVEHEPKYLPGHGLTWCNRYVSDVTMALDCPIPFRLANEQVLWLDSIEGTMDGWERTDPYQAQVALDRGEVIVVGWFNSTGHGHIAMGIPAISTELHISQAGSRNFNNKPVSSGFGTDKTPYIWRHS